MQNKVSSPVIVALDFSSGEQALALAKRLDPGQCRVKIGKELFTRAGPALLEQIQGLGFEVFLDLKFHDIPNTVAKACEAAAALGVWMVNVHASGGSGMMRAAREAINQSEHKPLLIGVTVLTSLTAEDLGELGINHTPEEQVQRLAKLTEAAGLDGVVCSPREVKSLRQVCAAGFKLVTPGVRPAGSRMDDQKRVMTPSDALQAGSDYLVIGRPITQAKDPLQALTEINQSLV